MPIIVEKSSANYTLMPEGLQQLAITEVKDLGLVDTAFGKKDKIRVRFANAAGDSVIRDYTKSLHEKSRLAIDLKAMTGKMPDKAFDAEKLVGLQSQALVSHEANTATGKTYANFTLAKPAVGQKVVPPAKSASAPATAPAAAAAPAVAPNAHGVSITDDDIPF